MIFPTENHAERARAIGVLLNETVKAKYQGACLEGGVTSPSHVMSHTHHTNAQGPHSHIATRAACPTWLRSEFGKLDALQNA
jgi:hypothetical protein